MLAKFEIRPRYWISHSRCVAEKRLYWKLDAWIAEHLDRLQRDGKAGNRVLHSPCGECQLAARLQNAVKGFQCIFRPVQMKNSEIHRDSIEAFVRINLEALGITLIERYAGMKRPGALDHQR